MIETWFTFRFKINALQVRKREKMAKIREEMAVQKAKETELNKTIHIQGLIQVIAEIDADPRYTYR